MLSVDLLCNYSVGCENPESLVKKQLLLLSESSQNPFSYLHLRTLFLLQLLQVVKCSSFFVNYNRVCL